MIELVPNQLQRDPIAAMLDAPKAQERPYCNACNRVGLRHCSDPEHCGEVEEPKRCVPYWPWAEKVVCQVCGGKWRGDQRPAPICPGKQPRRMQGNSKCVLVEECPHRLEHDQTRWCEAHGCQPVAPVEPQKPEPRRWLVEEDLSERGGVSLRLRHKNEIVFVKEEIVREVQKPRISRDELELALNVWVEEYAGANGPTSRDDRRVALRAALQSIGIVVEE